MSCPHNFLPQGGKYPLCGIDGGICFGPDHHRWDECPVYFGPWGAWRAFVAQIRNFDNGYVYIAGPAWWSDEVWFMPQKTIAASGWMP